MKREIPQPARELLARLPAPDEHPSADLLNGFAEQALGPSERQQVTAHLATCADCREIVFLASAAEEHVPTTSAASSWTKSRRPWLKWLAPALAAVALAGGITLRFSPKPRSTRSQIVAMKRAPAPSATPADKLAPAENEPLSTELRFPARAAPAKANAAPAKKARAGSQAPHSPAVSVQPSHSENQQTVDSALPAPSPPAQTTAGNSAPPLSEAQPARSRDALPNLAIKSALQAKAAPSAKSVYARASGAAAGLAGAPSARPRAAVPGQGWRITEDGHLQHASSSGDWTRVLADQPVAFHAVTVLGDEVWAGGSDGALFHSTDAGEQWSRIILAAGGEPERGTVVTIRFDDPLHGSVGTESSATWTTADGGKTWKATE